MDHAAARLVKRCVSDEIGIEFQGPPTVSAAVTTAAVTNGGGSDHGGQVAVAVSAGNAEAGSGNQVDQVELEVNESIIGAVIGPQVNVRSGH